MRRRTSTALLSALALLAPACTWNVGSVEVHLVRTPENNRDPFENVVTLRIHIEGKGLSPRETSVYLHDGRVGTLSDIPVGRGRILTVEGMNVSEGVVSRGVSAPFATGEGTTTIYLYFSQVNRFSGPPVEMDAGFAGKYRIAFPLGGRVFHAAAPLPCGKALIAGGLLVPPVDFLGRITKGDDASGTADVFDATAAAFESERLLLTNSRVHHSVAADPGGGFALLIGGEPNAMGSAGYYAAAAGRIEQSQILLDPASPRTRHGTAVVSAGRSGIVVAGGNHATPGDLLDEVAIFEQGRFELLASLSLPRTGCRAVAYPGGVAVVGGWQDDGSDGLEPSARVDCVSLDGPNRDFEMHVARAEHTAVLVGPDDDPRLFVCGGLGDPDDDGVLEVLDTCELIDFLEEPPVFVEDVDIGRWAHTATVLPDGSVLVAGGFKSVDPAGPTGLPAHKHATRFDELMRTPWKISNPIEMVAGRAGHTSTLLSNGMVVLTGGISKYDVTGEDPRPVMPDQDYEIFNPD